MEELKRNTIESSELVEQTFRFWFSNNNHIRSPFPNYIHTQLKVIATDKFYDWIAGLHPKTKDELNDEIVGEKFEELIFESALNLVKTEDEKTTILYPFLPRLGDKLKNGINPDSVIIDRMVIKEGDNNFLKIILENTKSKEKWDTKIELPI